MRKKKDHRLGVYYNYEYQTIFEYFGRSQIKSNGFKGWIAFKRGDYDIDLTESDIHLVAAKSIDMLMISSEFLGVL